MQCFSGTSDRLLACPEGWWYISTCCSNERVRGTSSDARCNAKLCEGKGSRGSGGPEVKLGRVRRLKLRGLSPRANYIDRASAAGRRS